MIAKRAQGQGSGWLWWTPTDLLWSDFWVADDFGNLQRVHLKRSRHSLSLS